MNCDTARLLGELSGPAVTELDPAEAAALREHLAGCPDCTEWGQRARRLDEHLGRAMRDVPLPAGLQDRLHNRLRAARSAQRRRVVVRAAAVAAAVLLALGLGWYWRLSLRPLVNADQVAVELGEMAGNRPDRVEDWFRARGVSMIAPAQFNEAPLNYALLESYGMAEFQGVQVPQLVFFYPGPAPALARIYVLTDRDFNLDQLVATRAAGSTHRVEVFRLPDNPHVAFVVVYTGDSLTPFFSKARPAA
jgi:hypothetical protein